MAGAKEIRTKIASIKKTQKITRAMEMVAASKMRKTQDRMRASRPYARKINQVVKHLAYGHAEYRHPFLEEREIKRVGVIVVSSDRGLCGGLNTNLFKSVTAFVKEQSEKQVDVDFCVLGRKGEAFFKRIGGNIVAYADGLGDTPAVSDLIGSVKVMLNEYNEKKIDALYIAFNEFVNTMVQKPTVQQLLPLPEEEGEKDELSHHWDYLYEPDAKELLDDLLGRYIELQVYQSIVENIACEQAAKMISMRSASDNAGDLIKEFQLAYNKARQSAITRELSEIVGGAAAL
jgi:F-type H+-transporting ATPase subunit gamma